MIVSQHDTKMILIRHHLIDDQVSELLPFSLLGMYVCILYLTEALVSHQQLLRAL